MRAVLLCQAAAFWPVWRWYLLRMSDGSDEPWGAAALLTAIVLSMGGAARRAALTRGQGILIAGSLAAYAAAYPFVTPLLRAGIAMASLAVSASALRGRKGVDLAILGVLLLSLPLIASLQFYLGFPLRTLSAFLAEPIIEIFGPHVTRRGAAFEWRGDLIAVDAPCSGVKMLWCGLFATFTLAAAARLGARATWRAYCAASVLIFGANVARVTTLFFSESRILSAPAYFHSGVGALLFAVVLFASALHIRRLAYAAHRCV